ncbi:DUF72 domain-containing protein [Pinibacter aurantiacus]|uniref:DUF72 domain-containing protein n=1 Tax=Pinibacter aurantiacus TaxID=2851599 RepID=A0A9E2W7V8_9BACT|nr:DUF72 domain-containing protein [Pinibacter aurantiacus]MBV4357346.1 DUF72 domain-containing protein [Pinibacter aurantiacus]
MNFGAEFENYTEQIFALPHDNEMNHAVLSEGNGAGKIYVGLERWGTKALIGTLYPSSAKSKEFLSLYAGHFNCIELNSTHYSVPEESAVKEWTSKVPDDFIFCPKYLQTITHSSLRDAEQFTEPFMQGLLHFGNKLGPIFLQFSESVRPGSFSKKLLDYLEHLRTLYPEQKFFVELRHPEWFEPNVWNPFTMQLKELKVGLVITDTPAVRYVLHMTLTIPEVFIRFVCLGNHPQDAIRIDQWKAKLEDWKKQGMERAFIFLHIQDEPQIASYAKKVQQLFYAS